MATRTPTPPGYENWHAQISGEPAIRAFEFALYTDAVLTDEIKTGLGPYQVLNTIGMGRPPRAGQRSYALVLLAAIHVSEDRHVFPRPDDAKVDVGSYHAGWLDDEFCALLSLALGIRCASGGMVRWYEPADAPRGSPFESDHDPPYLPPPPRERRTVLPGVARELAVSEAKPLLEFYPSVPPDSTRALIRAARLYQQGLWNADADPNLAWIQLVSAIEVVAGTWQGVAKLPPLERVRRASPELAAMLEAASPEVRDAVSKYMAQLVRSKARFLQFLECYKPEPSQRRPSEAFRLNWNGLEEALEIIYGHRSKALHEGVPFPSAMCEPPISDDDGIPWEVPAGLGTGSGDAYWPAEATPMHLHLFAHIVGESLRAWWRELGTGGQA